MLLEVSAQGSASASRSEDQAQRKQAGQFHVSTPQGSWHGKGLLGSHVLPIPRTYCSWLSLGRNAYYAVTQEGCPGSK